MSDLAGHVADYLKMRRALGFKLKREGQVLPQLVAYLEAAGAATLTAELAISWARLPRDVAPINWAHRLGAARGFAAYLNTIDPSTGIPARGVFPARVARRIPYLWSQDEVCALLAAAPQLRPPLRAATHEALFGLIAVSGMRIGEAIGLTRDDVDLTGGVLTIRDAKFGHSRLVPLHPSATDALRSYATCRDRLYPKPRSRTFFLSSVGTALSAGGVHHTFNQLTTLIGLRGATARPRVHDLRHSFAVRTLVDWHRSGADVAGRMAVLSGYLGHVNPAGTYWYLSASPELMALAAARLDARYGQPR
ncbi:MAG: tyrosine-type recombinase/integrase [Pseudonocardiaceae bacterium]